MQNLESRVKRLEESAVTLELGPVNVGFFDDLLNSRKDLKDGELLGVRVNGDVKNLHFPRLPGEAREACFARVKALHGDVPMFPICSMEYNGKLVVRGTKSVNFPPFDWRKSGQMKYDRFVLLQVNPRKLLYWKDGRPHVSPTTDKEKEMEGLNERLRQEFLTHPERSREEKNEIAKRHGFRVIYPDSPDSEALW